MGFLFLYLLCNSRALLLIRGVILCCSKPVARMYASHGDFVHGLIQQMLSPAGATFIELAKISTIAVPARTRRASYTGTWPKPRPLLWSTEAVGATGHSCKLS